MKSMLTHFLFAVLLMLPVVSIDAGGQDEDSINRDLTELLEMQLADAKQENVRLSAKVSEQAASLEALRKASANDAGQDKVRKLESENVLLKAELEKLDEDLKRAAEARKALTRQIEDVRGELAQADTAPVPPVVTAGDYDELRARRKNLEDENAILKREIDGLTKRAETAEADRDRIKGDLDRLFAEDKRSDEKPDASRRELDRLKKVLAATQDELEDVRSSAIDDKQAVGLAKELEERKHWMISSSSSPGSRRISNLVMLRSLHFAQRSTPAGKPCLQRTRRSRGEMNASLMVRSVLNPCSRTSSV